MKESVTDRMCGKCWPEKKDSSPACSCSPEDLIIGIHSPAEGSKKKLTRKSKKRKVKEEQLELFNVKQLNLFVDT